jgi:hypothetical protein
MEGVYIGRDNHGAAAAGTGATASVNYGAGPDDRLARVKAAVDKLHAAIDAVPELLADPDAALRDVNAIAAAMDGDPPDAAAAMAGARRLLDRITAAGVFVSAAENLRQAL